MPLVRAYDGPRLGHAVTVVPVDPQRCGALVRVRGWEIAVADPVQTVTTLEDLTQAATDVGWDAERTTQGPPFDGGLLGFITDDVSFTLLELPQADVRPSPAPLPPLWFGRYTYAACQAPDGSWWLTGTTPRDLRRAEDLLRQAAALAGEDEGTEFVVQTQRPAWTTIDRLSHAKAVGQIHDWIAAGEVYQVNLTLHVAAPWEGSPRQLAFNLFGASQGAAHAAFLHAPGATITSVSPETFLRIDGRRAQVRPIKGTRRRSGDAVADQLLAADLMAASKDGAEHVMIVDLERNDLGRICRTASVTVPQLMGLERHPTVWHLTSTVQGDILPDVDFGQVVQALFPCGSITGAPKRMAVSLTRVVEPWRRGVYCGAIGVITTGLVDLSVAIRTAVMHGGQAWYGTGGGIVADSDPEAEWDEAMAKAEAFFQATRTRPPA
ncbi:MAG: anthranilate synthase component I family protein [Euzebya sp.]